MWFNFVPWVYISPVEEKTNSIYKCTCIVIKLSMKTNALSLDCGKLKRFHSVSLHLASIFFREAHRKLLPTCKKRQLGQGVLHVHVLHVSHA